MAAITGARDTLNVSQTQRKPDIASMVLLLEPDSQPLTIFSNRASNTPTTNPEFSWFEDQLEPRFATQAGGATNSATTINVTTGQGDYFGPQDLFLNTRTFEVVRVVSVATDALTVVRGIGSTGTAMLDLDELLILGSAALEGDTSKAARTRNPTKVSNYTQIFRKPVEATETQRHTDQFTQPNDWNYQLKKAGIEHQKDKEYAYLLGTGSEDTSGAHPRRTTKGIRNYIATNVTAVGGAMTETTFFGAVRPAMRYGTKTKLLLCSALVVDVLNTYARSKVQVPDQSINTYGVKVMQYISPHGTLFIATHWLLEGAKFAGYAIGIDMSQVKTRYLANSEGSRDTHLRSNIQAPDADTQKDEYLAETGLMFGSEKAHLLITGVTG